MNFFILIIDTYKTQAVNKMALMYLETPEDYDCAAEWLMNEVKKNKLLPELPFELWQHIYSFVPQQLDICFAPIKFNPYLLRYPTCYFTDSDSDSDSECPDLISL